MFDRILIANRGEIALRIIRACRELGIESVAAHSQADAESLPVQLADHSICIGPAAASESYLKIPNLISAAEVMNADAIHPGYGFLAENKRFAELCGECNIVFIGPEPDHIERLGDKSLARETMRKAGVPVMPGSLGVVENLEEARKVARDVGYPVLIKALAGGGGKGMRIAHSESDLKRGFETARAEAERAFGNSAVYLEKFVERGRHIEVQILGDKHGTVLHLGERDCSIQRRHQKLIEESPSPFLPRDQRKKIGRAAVKGAQAVKYSSAGTMEFLFDEGSGKFYFIEMNTRIQVEHPITEEVTGKDLVREMILIAAGEKLSFGQKEVVVRGHAIEFRVNAEDPYRSFMPSPGVVEWVNFPGGLGGRVDSHIYSGYEIPPHYDSLIAKLIVSGDDREQACNRLERALGEFLIDGPASTIPLGQALLRNKEFRAGSYHTRFLEKVLAEGLLDLPGEGDPDGGG